MVLFVVVVAVDVAVACVCDGQTEFVQPVVRAGRCARQMSGRSRSRESSNTPFHEAVASFGHGHPLNSALRRWGGSSLNFRKNPSLRIFPPSYWRCRAFLVLATL
jgi:hypothetical protein